MKMQQDETGLFGKLPAHGDFVQRNLPAGFITRWDEWLQHFIAGTQEQLAENWLDIYLTSPIWRFVFSSGVIDENIWTGIMMPSVDRVWRYFPVSIVRRLPVQTNPFEFLQNQDGWFSATEELALQALDGEIQIDDLMQQLNELEMTAASDYSRNGIAQENQNSFQLNMEFEEQSVSSVYPMLLDSIMTQQFKSYSIWKTTGSDYIEPCFFCTQGLPDIQRMPAMIKGDWQNYQWHQPYSLQEFSALQGGL